MLYRFRGFDLDDESFALRRDGCDVPLRPQALDLLIYLVRNRDRVVTKEELLDAVWRGIAVSSSTLPQTIVAVRRALDDDGSGPELIQTARGRGYRFMAEVATPATSPVSDLVGRAYALQRLDERLRDAAEGRGAITFVTGPPGIGKTRLLGEIGRRARESGARVLEARCAAEPRMPDLWLWVQLLRAHAAAPPGPGVREAASLATELRGSSENAAQERRFVAFDRVVELFRRIAQRAPVVLLIDDLHRADAASLLLLKFFGTSLRSAAVAVIVTYRDRALTADPVLARTLGALMREDPSCRITLERLTRAEVAQFSAATLGRDIDEPLLDRLCKKTDGNPLLLTQMLHAILREDASASPLRASTSALLAIGEMREAIGMQLEELSPKTRDVLRAAAVLGTELTLARLAGTLGVSPGDLLPPLDEALGAGVLAKISPGAYRFVHVLVRDVLYRSLSLAERARLHEAAGAVALAHGAPDDAVLHLERALRELDMLAAASADAGTENPTERAQQLLRILRAGAPRGGSPD